MQYRKEVIAPMQAHTQKLRQHSMQMKQQDLAYESQKLELEQARQKTQSQLKFLERQDELMQDIDSIIETPTNSFEANKSLLKLGSKWMTEFPHSPLLTNLLTSAGKVLEVSQIQENKEEARLDREERLKYAQMSSLSQQGALEATVAAAGPDVDKFEKPYIDLARHMEKGRLASGVVAQQEAQAESIDNNIRGLKDMERSLTGMNSQEGDLIFSATGEASNMSPAERAKVAADTMILDKGDIMHLREIYLDLMTNSSVNIDVAALEKVEGQKLYEMTLKKIFELRRLFKAYGEPEKETAASKLTKG